MTPAKTVLLISANRHCDPYPVYPLGVSYLATALKNSLDGFEILVFDINLSTVDELSALIRERKPDYIGLSLRNADGANSLEDNDFMAGYRELAKIVRANSKAPLIIGGAGFSIFPEIFMRELGADYGIRGEGEKTLPELIEKLEKGEPVERVEGLVVREGDGFRINERHCFLQTLQVDFEDSLAGFYWKQSGMLNIQTKRGCPFHCVYCSYPVIEGRTVRTLDSDAVVDNILRLKKEKGIDYLFFTDSVFNICNDYNRELAEKLIRSGADISWGAYFTPRNLDDESMELFKRSGLTHIEFGSESFSDECLSAYGKSFNFEDILKCSELSLKHQVYYAHFLIFGGYGETRRTVEETIRNAKKLEYTVFFPFVGMRIYPHTALREIAVREGVITAEDDLMVPKYYLAKDFDLEETRKIALESGKAWIFPDDPKNAMMDELRIKRNKKGPIWEYLRKP